MFDSFTAVALIVFFLCLLSWLS